jgi:transposase
MIIYDVNDVKAIKRTTLFQCFFTILSTSLKDFINLKMPYQIPSDKLNSVKALILQGAATNEVVQRTGVSKWTINRMKAQLNPDYEQPRGERPSPLSNTTKIVLRCKVRCGSLRSSRDARRWLLSLGYFIDERQVRNLMRQLNLVSFIKKKRPFYKRNHPMDRLKWAKQHRDWTVDDWEKVIFSDETKINTWVSDRNGRFFLIAETKLSCLIRFRSCRLPIKQPKLNNHHRASRKERKLPHRTLNRRTILAVLLMGEGLLQGGCGEIAT